MKPRSTPRRAVIELPFIAKPRLRGSGGELCATIAAGSMFQVGCMPKPAEHPNGEAGAAANDWITNSFPIWLELNKARQSRPPPEYFRTRAVNLVDAGDPRALLALEAAQYDHLIPLSLATRARNDENSSFARRYCRRRPC